jgi:hypothetical protein
MRKHAAALLTAVSIFASCSDRTPTAPTAVAPPPIPPIPAIRVSGRVVDYRSGQPVAGTAITWRERSSSSSAPHTVTADAAGRFEIALPIADTFSIEIKREAAPFATIDNPVLQSGIVRVPGKRLESDFLVNPGPCAARYGYVFDAVTRQPIAGARVSRAGTASTDANGYYRIDIGCEPRNWGIGTTTISVSHTAYQGTFEFDGRREHTSSSGLRRIDFALQPLP